MILLFCVIANKIEYDNLGFFYKKFELLDKMPPSLYRRLKSTPIWKMLEQRHSYQILQFFQIRYSLTCNGKVNSFYCVIKMRNTGSSYA